MQLPTKREIVKVLRRHPLIRLKGKVKRAYLVGSFSCGREHAESDVDILLEVESVQGYTDLELTDFYRRKLRQYFVSHNIRGKADSVHPQWEGRRVDLYLTYDFTNNAGRPYIQLKD